MNSPYYPYLSGLTGLLENVYSALYHRNPEASMRFRQLMVNVPMKPCETNISYMNRLWRYQLMLLTHVDTRMERECLCVSYDDNIWFQRFETQVLPTLLKHNLPYIGE